MFYISGDIMNEYVKQIACGALYQFAGSIYENIHDMTQSEFINRLQYFIEINGIYCDYPAIRSWEKIITTNVINKNINDYGLECVSIYKLPYDERPYPSAHYIVSSMRYSLYDIIDQDISEIQNWMEIGLGETIQTAINDYVWKRMGCLAIPFDLLYNGGEH